MKNDSKKRKNRNQVVSRLMENRSAMIGLIILVIMMVLAVFANVIIPYKYDLIDFACAYEKPSLRHLCGCDELGRDILSRLLYGSRYSLAIGIISVGLALVFGSSLGAVAGYFGGLADSLIMRFLDILSAIPSMLMAIVVSAVLGPGFDKCFIAIAISTMPQYARIIRSQILSMRDMEYIEAATSIRCGTSRIILRHIIPNCFSAVLVAATMNVGSGILMAASLSYIGLGVQPPTPEWGAMLAGARAYIRDFPHMIIFPGLAIMVTVLCLNLLGDGLRDAVDPKLKK